ncbi:DUF2334 domain-containing protein [Effusibacillus consociatus]|uniref:DUF2334 domain-containing protein n=1 Tax=Effusibacillus consociatus TaxID=1117041 RepID=A0ABV9Q1E7_9BACL
MFPRADHGWKRRPALLRLEDVGPGGSFRTADDLGRLRAVFEYLKFQNVPYHVALIPRWISLQPDGSWYDKGIDALYPDKYMRGFLALMQKTQREGALFGAHGYTHQYGDRKMPDDDQDSGTGSEFNVKGASVTTTPSYTVDRITRSLFAFQKAGLYPHFWESPHYNHTLEQEAIFERFRRVIYQSDVRGRAGENAYLSETGVVYIPTPLGYIHEQNSIDQVLSKLPTFRGVASIFYHPFLEFLYLEPVKDAAGHSVIREELPVYRYKPGEESPLQRLVKGFREHGLHWVSLYELVPQVSRHSQSIIGGR